MNRGVLRAGYDRKKVDYSSYLVNIAKLNFSKRSVYGFDWWTEFFNNLAPKGPLFQITHQSFSPLLIPEIKRLETKYFDYVVMTAKTISPPLREVLSVHYAALATFFQGHKQFRPAIPFYRNSLEYNQDQAVLRNNLGICLENSGYTTEAITQYQKTIEQRPDYTSPYGNLGLLYYRQGEKNKAIQIITRALEVNPNGEYAEQLRRDLLKIKKGEPIK